MRIHAEFGQAVARDETLPFHRFISQFAAHIAEREHRRLVVGGFENAAK